MTVSADAAFGLSNRFQFGDDVTHMFNDECFAFGLALQRKQFHFLIQG